jgi:voltage-gated potassium channel
VSHSEDESSSDDDDNEPEFHNTHARRARAAAATAAVDHSSPSSSSSDEDEEEEKKAAEAKRRQLPILQQLQQQRQQQRHSDPSRLSSADPPQWNRAATAPSAQAPAAALAVTGSGHRPDGDELTAAVTHMLQAPEALLLSRAEKPRSPSAFEHGFLHAGFFVLPPPTARRPSELRVASTALTPLQLAHQQAGSFRARTDSRAARSAAAEAAAAVAADGASTREAKRHKRHKKAESKRRRQSRLLATAQRQIHRASLLVQQEDEASQAAVAAGIQRTGSPNADAHELELAGLRANALAAAAAVRSSNDDPAAASEGAAGSAPSGGEEAKEVGTDAGGEQVALHVDTSSGSPRLRAGSAPPSASSSPHSRSVLSRDMSARKLALAPDSSPSNATNGSGGDGGGGSSNTSSPTAANGVAGAGARSSAAAVVTSSAVWARSSPRRNVWGSISLLALLYYLFLVPFQIAFYSTAPATSRDRAWHALALLPGWVCDAWFVADIVLRLTTFVRVEADGAVLFGWAGARLYVRSWTGFPLHVLAALPIDVLLLVGGGPVQAVYWVRLLRLLRCVQLGSLLKHLEAMLLERLHVQLDQISVRIGKVVLFFLASTHIMACLYFFVGYTEARSTSWLFRAVSEPAELDDSAFWYVRSLWWATASAHGTAGGKGRYPPRTTIEMLVASLLQLMSAGTDVLFIGTFTIIINSTDASYTRFDRKLQLVKRYCNYRHLPLSLRRRILAYYSYLWQAKRGVEESTLLADVPFNLKEEVLAFRSSSILGQVPLFSSLSPAIIRSISVHLRSQTFPPGELVVEAGDEGREMFFVEQGVVEVVEPASREMRGKLGPGSFFGELALLTGARRTMHVRTARNTFVDLFILRREDFDTVLAQHPTLRSMLLEKVKGFLTGQHYAANRNKEEDK